MATDVGQKRLVMPSLQEAIDWQVISMDVIQEWAASTRDALHEVENITLKAESEGISKDGLQRIRAHLHNMKGEAGFVGLEAVGRICHDIETELEGMESNEDFAADLILDAVDWFAQILDAVELGPDAKSAENVMTTTQKPRVLIVEDGVINRKLLEDMLKDVSACDVAVDGEEGVRAFMEAMEISKPYDLIFLDIMMPKMDGQAVLAKIREEENARGILGSDGVKVVMTTALKDSKNVLGAFRQGCEGYLVKPIERDALYGKMRELKVL